MPVSDRLKHRIGKIASATMALPRLMTRPPRERTFRAGLLLANGERIAIVVKDVNETGARVEFVSRAELPPSVLLVEPTLKLHRRATVVWQSAGAAGLQF